MLSTMPRILHSLLVFATLSLTAALEPSFASTKPVTSPGDYRLRMHIKVPMRDGVRLNATLYLPDSTTANGPNEPSRVPLIFMLSPYPDDTSHPTAAYFAKYGYGYAYVDVRGRGDSGGVFKPLDEAQDGADAAEWFAKQQWCDGQVAMFGGSYAGGDQWQAASEHPAHLKAIAPVASARAGIDFPFAKNIFLTYDLQWLAYVSGHVLYSSVFNDSVVWANAQKRLFLDKASFRELEQYAGISGTAFKMWLEHPEVDSYWRRLAIAPAVVQAINLPVLAITGTHDGDQPGTLSFYRDHLRPDGSVPQNYHLVIGPWDHAGTRDPKQDVGGEHFGPAAMLDVLRLHREWYDSVLKDGATPAFLKQPVAWYVAGPGAECWKGAASLNDATLQRETLYLDAAGGAASIYHSGLLTPSARNLASVGGWVSDPNDLSAAEPQEAQPGATLHGDGLVFHSAPFTEDREITGDALLQLWLTVDTPDTDVTYDLSSIDPNGKAHELTYGLMRARYRHSLEHAEMLHEGQPELFSIPDQMWTSYRAPKGSSLRLVIGAQNDPSVEKNWNSVKPSADQNGKDARIAHIRLLQDAAHPSTLSVPYGDPKANCNPSASW